MADAVKAVADVVADGATDLVTGATAPVVSEEDLVVALVVAAATSNFEVYDYLCAVANYSLFILHFDQSHPIDFANLLAGLSHEFHANLCLALKHLGRNVERLVLELRDAVLARVVD